MSKINEKAKLISNLLTRRLDVVEVGTQSTNFFYIPTAKFCRHRKIFVAVGLFHQKRVRNKKYNVKQPHTPAEIFPTPFDNFPQKFLPTHLTRVYPTNPTL
jgi:hypothetical protein